MKVKQEEKNKYISSSSSSDDEEEKVKELDLKYYSKYKWILGCDECGRGNFAGEVVAVAYAHSLTESGPKIKGVKDSKKLSESERISLAKKLKKQPKTYYAIATRSPRIIEEINILNATLEAMSEAIKSVFHKLIQDYPELTQKEDDNNLNNINIKDTIVLIDGNKIPADLKPSFQQSSKKVKSTVQEIKISKMEFSIPVEAIVKGDEKIYAISAASIIGKTFLNKKMIETYDKLYPQYGFNNHKGYGTPKHLDNLEKYGPCEIHRQTYKPVKMAKERKDKMIKKALLSCGISSKRCCKIITNFLS